MTDTLIIGDHYFTHFCFDISRRFSNHKHLITGRKAFFQREIQSRSHRWASIFIQDGGSKQRAKVSTAQICLKMAAGDSSQVALVRLRAVEDRRCRDWLRYDDNIAIDQSENSFTIVHDNGTRFGKSEKLLDLES